MRVKRIKNPDENGFFTVAEGGDFEYGNPLEKIEEAIVLANIVFEENIFLLKAERDAELKKLIENRKMFIPFLYERAMKEWNEKKKEILSTEVPAPLFKILECNSKKDQIRLLRRLTITNKEFTAFICHAGERHGFKYSLYKSHHHSKGIDENELPEIFYSVGKEDKVKVIGDTSMSDGQLRQAIDHRKVVVAKFLDNEDSWHCFTFKSLRGEERWEHPHLHYISNAWGIDRSDVVSQLKEKKYSLPSLPHINYHTHRNPKDDKKEK
jgi:hypothetical protein